MKLILLVIIFLKGQSNIKYQLLILNNELIKESYNEIS